MVKDGTRGKIIFVSSVVGYMSFVGYSTYSPAKFALRGPLRHELGPCPAKLTSHATGLAETLRNEMLLYGIDVHIMFPGTILSPGYEEENKTKPDITLKIEGADDGMKPVQVAEKLLDGWPDTRHWELHALTLSYRRATRLLPHLS
jgi:3-dehydrosphinganine reductase